MLLRNKSNIWDGFYQSSWTAGFCFFQNPDDSTSESLLFFFGLSFGYLYILKAILLSSMIIQC